VHRLFHRALPLVLAALGAAAIPAASAFAELIVFEDGRVVKAAGYRLDAERDELEVRLPGGGSYLVDLSRVERIVDDEVVVSTVAVEDLRPQPAAPYDLSYTEARRPLFGSSYDALIEKAARAENLDASFVSALIRAESNYEPRAISRKGARGLMQLMPATAKRLSVRKPFDPEANVRGGVRYLRELVDRFGHRPDLVLAAYNAGEGAVDAYGGVPPYRETVAYVARIMSWWQPRSAAAAGAAGAGAAAAAVSAPR
jgi:soluble lytic murein transglycosylase-like protein